MFVNVSRTKINKYKENKITSHIIFEPHRRQSIGNLKLHEEGIFSKKIFGNFYKCECGEKYIDDENIYNINEKIFCDKCNTRVISQKHIPDFFIDLTIHVPVFFAEYDTIEELSEVNISKEDAECIMKYEKFVYKENSDVNKDNFIICALNESFTNFELFDQNKVLIGIEALKFLGVNQDWLDENTVDYLSIPHPSYRPLISDNMATPYITGINMLYSNIIKKINDAIDMKELSNSKPFYLMILYKMIIQLYNEIIENLFDELQNVKYSTLKNEIISHPISGAIRAVLTNRHDINEDILLVGDTFVETLWPYLYEKYNGDMIFINEELVDKNYKVLVNRPPTIGHLSIIAMKPRISSIYPFNKTKDTEGCLLHNYGYAVINEDTIGEFKDDAGLLGDIEKFGQGLDSGVDTCGLRVISMNPIVFDGLQGDVDGDVLLVIALYSNESLKQAETMLPSNSFKNYANGEIRNKIIADFIFTDENL